MATIFSEDFEGATQGAGQGTLGAFGFVSGTALSFTDGAGDFLTVTDGAGEFGSFVQYAGASGQFLAGMDLNGEGAALPIVIEAGGIDISGFTDLGISLRAAEDDDGTNQDWDLADFVHVSARIDGGAFFDVLNFESIPDGDAFNAVPALDAGFDGDGDAGRELTDAFATFSSAIAGTGATLDLRITLNLDSGDEDIALDDILLTGTPGDVPPPPPAAVRINEFQPNPIGTDPATQTVELSGAPGAAFSGWLLGIESDGANGTVDRAAEISGSFDASGLLTVSIPDLENPSFTLVLAEDFTGSAGSTDIDADNDGTADDLSAFGTILDAIGIPDTAGDEASLYGADLGGTDFAFTGDEPRLVFRDGATGDLYALNDPDGGQVFDTAGSAIPAAQFDTDPTAGSDSFGAVNPAFVGGGTGASDRFIHEIQGATDLADGTPVGVPGAADETPLLGQAVRVQAVVTEVLPDLGGFFIQEEEADADADPFTSEGLFVFAGFGAALPAIGDLVTVEGSAGEFEGQTQIAASAITVDGTAPLPAAAVVTFPTATVLQDADGDFVANLEAYEGMRITVPEAMSVTELFQLDRFGTIRLSSEGRLEQFTQSNAPSVAGFAQHLKDVAARSLVIDDGSNAQNPSPIPVPGLGADGTLDNGDVVRMGDQYTGLTGVLAFSEDDQTGSEEPEFRLHRPDGTLSPTNPRPATAPEVGSDFTVASFNVLNFFTTLDTFPGNEGVGPAGLSPRGADTNPQNALPGTGALDEFDRQVAKLVEAMVGLGADVFGLTELENDFLAGGDSPDDPTAQGTRGPAIQFLVDAINAVVGAGTYDWVRPDGEFVGGDAIAVGLIYDTTTTEIAPGTTTAVLTDAGLAGLGLDFGNPVFDGPGTSRAPIAATFREIASGGDVTVAVNHFKSKGSISPFGDNADKGDGQGNNNEARVQAATALDAWLDSDPTGSTDPDVLILGDLNAYANEDPVTFLEGQGYTDLAEQFLGAGRSSFVFDGQTGTLDYALANSSLGSQVTGAAEWHINADEADALDYNLEFGRDPALFTATDPFRASDHDPVLVGLDLDGAPAVNLVEGGPGRDKLIGSAGDDLVQGGGGSDIVTTLAGNDVIDFADLVTNGRRDYTIVTDYEIGADILGGIGAGDVARSFSAGSRTVLILEPDSDIVVVFGVTDIEDIAFENDLLV